MAVVPNKRTGLPTARVLAVALCRLVTKFAPIIRTAYPDSPLLHAALEAALAACSTLVEEIDKAIEPGV